MRKTYDAEHCDDCCRARSWEALGITEYTGKSIPEHILDLKASLALNASMLAKQTDLARDAEAMANRQDKEIKRLTESLLYYVKEALKEQP